MLHRRISKSSMDCIPHSNATNGLCVMLRETYLKVQSTLQSSPQSGQGNSKIPKSLLDFQGMVNHSGRC